MTIINNEKNNFSSYSAAQPAQVKRLALRVKHSGD